jgi:hypothetical protein
MNKPFNIHDWQAKQKQQRLDEQYYVTVNRGRGGGKRLVRSAESDYEEPRVFSNYGEAEKYIKQAKSGGATPGQITSYWVSDENMNRIEDPVVAKEVMHTNDVKLLQDLLEKYSLDKIITNLKVINGLKEHHDDKDFPGKDLSAWDLLDKIQKADKDLYNNVEKFMKSMTEMSTTGTGASFNAGSGEGYMTPKAFKKTKRQITCYYKNTDHFK